ncbi:AI-2E family transporter [Solirubrobacter ginsenosidimutans]|uniref:AI-2E family transporter n=1 Tax=Solirubrobacter ginsenosidimutans TaxID=490573 RepID=A0A9X3MNK2_9ACTN|nr:AI-2E family transporter [Solirubrobacter ginsenosidimutans]MDA0159876.1 AI-2E family transporter [Solirubrobacter ginsenosidimutans]
MATDADQEPPPRIEAQLGAPSLRGVARLVAIVAACAGALYVLYLTRGVIKIFVIALFTATALGPVVDAVQRSRLPRAWAIVAVYLACLVSVLAVGALVVPSVSSQVGHLSADAQHAVADLRANPHVRGYDDRYHITEKVQAQLRNLPAQTGRVAGPLRDVTVGAIGFASNLVAVLSIAFLLILHRDRYLELLLSALPAKRAERWRRIAPRIYVAVSGYVLGNLAISVIAGACAWIAMTVLGIPFAVPLALLIAFLDLIPMIGATLGAAVVALAALLVSPLAAALWLAYAIVYQQAENYLIQPVVYRRAVQVSALATIVAVLIGGTLLGLLGALLAIPAAATVSLVVQDLRAPQPLAGGDGARTREHDPETVLDESATSV